MTAIDDTGESVLIVGASGGIGRALLHHYLATPRYSLVCAVSRSARPGELEQQGERLQWFESDYSQVSIGDVLRSVASRCKRMSRVVICNGILHNERVAPEKALARLDAATMLEVLQANVVVPASWVAALPTVLGARSECVVAVLSARVGSIGDNRMGGWYSYRASKAALNMTLKSAAVEYARRFPGVKLLAFHPGTTDTELSRPFQRGVAPEKLFTPAFVAQRLSALLDELTPDGELSFLAWDGRSIEW